MVSLCFSFLLRFCLCLEVLELNAPINESKRENRCTSHECESTGAGVRSRRRGHRFALFAWRRNQPFVGQLKWRESLWLSMHACHATSLLSFLFFFLIFPFLFFFNFHFFFFFFNFKIPLKIIFFSIKI